MSAPLVACPTCSRHVRLSESACPFCAAALPAGLVAAPLGPRRPYVGKGATALALTLAALGCAGKTEESPADAAVDAMTKDTGVSDSGTDTGVLDTGTDTGADVMDTGGPVPIYK